MIQEDEVVRTLKEVTLVTHASSILLLIYRGSDCLAPILSLGLRSGSEPSL
jgi:hypothetical protein